MEALEAESKQVERQLRALDREQHQLLQWALKGFPENQVEEENKRINNNRDMLLARKIELDTRMRASHDAVVSLPKLGDFIERIQSRISGLDFEGKRLALDMLDVKVWLDEDSVEITGIIDTGIVPTRSEGR
jgi:GGDEF domain-containing protein